MNTGQRLSLAGKELLRGNLGNAIKSLSVTSINPSTYRSEDSGSMWMFGGTNGNDIRFSFSGLDSAVKAYQTCSPVSAVINRKAQCFINGKLWVLNSKGKEARGEKAGNLYNLLKRPNRLQSWRQFEAQGYIYQQLFGYNVILPNKPKGFPNIDATEIWNIPPFMLEITESKGLFYSKDTKQIIEKIVLVYKNRRQEISPADVFIMRDFSPSFDTMAIPDSRIRSLEMPINNIIGAYESRNVLINYRGALGAFTNDPGSGQFGGMPLTPKDKEDLQKDFKRYGLKNNQWQFIITSASLRWQQIGVATKDLMLFEEIDDDVMRVCDSYGYPYRLLSSNKGNSLAGSDVAEYKKNLYQDAIIPEAESCYEQWNEFFGLDELNLRLDKDFSHLPILQEDQLKQAQARKARNDAYLIEWQNNLITRNQWRVANGEDPVPGDDIYYRDVKAKENPDPVAADPNSNPLTVADAAA